jgi:pimeloyl-ACP methyl ester carboxylesterase
VWRRLDDEHHREPALTAGDLTAIATPTLLMFADGESEVVPEHVHRMRQSMPNAQLAIVPAASHGLPVDRPELSNLLVTKFLLGEP